MMFEQKEALSFQSINRGFDTVFRPNRLTLGLVVPIETYPHNPVPTMVQHLERVRLVEALGFAAIWLRDVPFNVPSFGDAGQLYDPFVYLGMLAAHTDRIALATGSIILPLRHPAHVAKAAVTADVLSGGRLILGVASGDRPDEYPALDVPFAERGKLFQESFTYIRRMSEAFPTFANAFGSLRGQMDMLPKPVGGKLPLLITGSSRQSQDWIAEHGDGWMTYPRNTMMQAQVIRDWRARVAALGIRPKPIMQPLYIDLTQDPNAQPQPIHLGMRLGINVLRAYLKSIESIGINHVGLNLRFNQADIETTLKILADELLPHFSG